LEGLHELSHWMKKWADTWEKVKEKHSKEKPQGQRKPRDLPWVTKEVRKKCDERSKAAQAYMKQPTDEKKDALKRARKEARKVCANAKEKCMEEMMKETTRGKVFTRIRVALGKGSPALTEPEGTADEVNNAFIAKAKATVERATADRTAEPPTPRTLRHPPPLSFIATDSGDGCHGHRRHANGDPQGGG